MISPELIRRYPFFAGLSLDQITALAKVGEEYAADEKHYFFHQGDELEHFYLLLEGEVGITVELPDQNVTHKISEQFSRDMKTRDVIVSTISPGEIFGWSGLVPPHHSTASAKVLSSGKVVSFDCKTLLPIFEEDCEFGYLMVQKAAQVIRDRLRDMRIESLAHVAAS